MNTPPSPQDIASALALPDAAALQQMQAWADSGSPDAQLVLGQMLLDGRGTAPAPQSALNWFVKAGRTGHPMAMNMVGRCYENGWGIQPDQETATSWFRNAAHAGLDWGMYNYATSLALGRGCERDLGSALEWLNKAVALGHVKSMNILGGFHEDGWATPKDMKQAHALYLSAARGGDFRGWFNLGRLDLQNGHRATALAYMHKALETATPAFASSVQQFMREHGLS